VKHGTRATSEVLTAIAVQPLVSREEADRQLAHARRKLEASVTMLVLLVVIIVTRAAWRRMRPESGHASWLWGISVIAIVGLAMRVLGLTFGDSRGCGEMFPKPDPLAGTMDDYRRSAERDRERGQRLIEQAKQGRQWTADAPTTAADLRAASSKSGVTWAVGDHGTVLMTGTVWESGTTEDLLAVRASSDHEAIAVGRHGAIVLLSTRDRAKRAVADTDEDLVAIDDSYVLGARGSILCRNRGDWSVARAAGAISNLHAIRRCYPGTVAVGDRGTILVATRDLCDGVSWRRVESGTDRDLYGIEVLDRRCCAFGGHGAIACTPSLDPSGPWELQPAFTDRDLHAALVGRPGQLFLGTGGAIFYRHDASGPWTPDPLSGQSDLAAVVVDEPSSTVFAVGAHGTVVRGFWSDFAALFADE
jgi:hypothetical protein